jgi:3-methyladenine DNA glycosylase AlkD
MTNDSLKKYLAEVEDKVNATTKNATEQRRLSKLKYSFSGQSSSEQLIIWDYIWNNSFDIWTCIQSFLYLESNMKNKQFLLDSWETIKYWQKSVVNWGMCDALSKIYTKILEIIPGEVLKQLEQWNKSTNLWDRRQSVVGLLYFSRTKKVVLPYNTIIPFINELIGDQEYYVQKGVGWALKELYNVYPIETLRYLEDNIMRVSSTAFGAATEKLKKEDKEKLIKIRKRSRQ